MRVHAAPVYHPIVRLKINPPLVALTFTVLRGGLGVPRRRRLAIWATPRNRCFIVARNARGFKRLAKSFT